MIRPRSRSVVARIKRLVPEPLVNRTFAGTPFTAQPLYLEPLEAIR
jgi:hypothetical protein